MKILRKTSQHTNDFTATLICPHCESKQDLKTGYDDAYYHNYVLPAIKCNSCGKNDNGDE